MRLLVIGGGWFVGRALVDAAVALGWRVTTFSRTGSGNRPGVEVVHGDRTSTEDLARLAARGAWDAVVDVPGVVPAQVRDSVRALVGHAERYVLVSSVSAYRDWPAVPVTEESPLLVGDPDEDPGAWQWGRGVYGRLKAGAEAALRRDLPPDRLLIIRPGVILGPGEYSGRLTWWLSRVARGGRMLAPGRSGRPIQPVDVRELARFVLDLIGRQASGTYNVAAPAGHATFGGMLDACRTVTGGEAEFVWAGDDWLHSQGVREWTELPLWRMAADTWQVDASRSHRMGLRCRPLEQTVRDTWAWLTAGGRPVDDPRRALHGIDPARETTLLAAWLTNHVATPE
ncbi:MAG TPA: NAD-dependent epimerase/dehydratase family protein [Micromonosporaceae bacterium]